MNGAVGFFDIRTGRPLRSLVSHSSAVDAIAFSADGRRVASVGSDGAVNVSDAATGQLLLRLTGHLAPVTGAAFSTDDRTLYTSSTDGTIIGWNLANPNNLGTQLSAEGTGAFSWVAVSPTGEIATEYRNGTVRFWAADSTSPTPPIPVANSALDGGSFSPNGRLFATAEKSGASHLVDVATRRVIGVLAQIPGGAHGAQFSPDGRTIALGDDSDKVYLINVASRQQIGTPLVADHPGELVWSPDSRRLAVQIGPTGDLTVYNLTSKAAAWQHPAVSSGVAWSPDGKTIATGGSSADGTQLWSAADGAPTGGGWQDHPITDDLAYSPDGSLLASAGLDGTVVLRDAATGDQFGPPLIADSSQQDHVWVDFDRADDLIVATSGGSLQRWHVNNLRYLLRQACTIAGRNLTRTEWNDLHTSHAYVRACR
jgi:WD40 repeat protein